MEAGVRPRLVQCGLCRAPLTPQQEERVQAKLETVRPSYLLPAVMELLPPVVLEYIEKLETVVATYGEEAAAVTRSHLDGPGQSRAEDPPTARAAAQVLGKPGTKRRLVLQAIADAGDEGLTSEEAVVRTGIEYRTLTPRVGELKRGGFITALDGVTRPGTHGVDQQVLVASVKGLAALGT